MNCNPCVYTGFLFTNRIRIGTLRMLAAPGHAWMKELLQAAWAVENARIISIHKGQSVGSSFIMPEYALSIRESSMDTERLSELVRELKVEKEKKPEKEREQHWRVRKNQRRPY